MSKRVAFLAILLALQGFAAVGEGAVLCVGESGHREIELANSPCCPGSATGRSAGDGWSAEDPCGPCTDYPYLSTSASSDASRTQRDHESGPLEAVSTGPGPEPHRQALARRLADPGERVLCPRIPSLLRV